MCDAALHLIDKPDAKSKSLLKWVKGPDFPTGGIIVDSKESIAEAYMTGRGSFRTHAKWTQEEGARGTWVVVITEIPWLVQKSRLVEKIAELLNEKKLPLVGDIRDESAEDVRLVIEIGDDNLNELARQPYDTLILGLNPRPRLDDEPRNVDQETEGQDQRQQQADPGTQGKFLPHGFRPRLPLPPDKEER